MLDPKAFDQAMNRLAILPVQGEDPADLLIRKEVYYEALSDLDTALFVAGAKAALRECRWFPTPAELRDCADAARPRLLALPPPARTPEQMEADREACRRGLELVRAAVAQTPAPPAPQPYIEPVTVVVVTPERVAELKAGLLNAGKEQVDA